MALVTRVKFLGEKLKGTIALLSAVYDACGIFLRAKSEHTANVAACEPGPHEEEHVLDEAL